ncbi:MAG: trehalose-phosphatase [Thermodesulfovibrionales bacterium]|nr:trehalose-phosphatase [Thermodesulfovibrionales bacterium]
MRKLMLFLDFDGTLSPIVKNPEEAVIKDKVKGWLKRLSEDKNNKIAIVTGRSLKDIIKKVGLKDVIYASNHGMEVYYGGRFLLRKATDIRRPLKRLERELTIKLSGIPDIFIENKGLSLAVHLRRVENQYHKEVKRIVNITVESWLKRYKLQLTGGKMLIEVRPLSWDKGKAVLWIWKRLAPKHLPVYVGDDVTDEDAFSALKPYGITIRIGRWRKSNAEYSVSSIEKLMAEMTLKPRTLPSARLSPPASLWPILTPLSEE